MTGYAGVISGPGKKSLSPVFQQAALDHLGLDIRYETWPTAAAALAGRVEGLRAPEMVGANVTIPHKEMVLPMMDELDHLAEKVGAVNTIVRRQGRLLGFNTDVGGFLRALREDGGFDPRERRAVIAGAGGAARAVAVALIQSGAAAVTIISRTLSRAVRLVDDLRPAGGTALQALPGTLVAWTSAVREADLLVNCTPAGSAGAADQSPAPLSVIRSDLFVYDLIYEPSETLLMAHARQQGAKVLGGLPMLIYQGAESLRLWTGREAPIKVMFEAVKAAARRPQENGGQR